MVARVWEKRIQRGTIFYKVKMDKRTERDLNASTTML